MTELVLKQPGNDGGVPNRRFQRARYPIGSSQDCMERLLPSLVEILLIKTRNPGTSEKAMQDMLIALAGTFRRSNLTILADAVPTSFKALLSLLLDQGIAVWQTEYYYKMCPCGTLYRTAKKDLQVCPRPTCMRPRCVRS
jgi:hypothetical protein